MTDLMKTFIEKIRNFFSLVSEREKPVWLEVKMEEGYEDLVPRKAHLQDAGYDLKAAIKEPVVIPAGECRVVSTGFSCALPSGYELQIRPRSGLALKRYISVLNTPGTIDCNYRGPVGVILFNAGKYPYTVQPGDRIAQGVVAALPKVRLIQVPELDNTDRGTGGFGSTGKS